MVSFTHVIKSPLFFDVLSRQTHIHLTGRFYFFQISFSIGMLMLFVLPDVPAPYLPKIKSKRIKSTLPVQWLLQQHNLHN